MSRPAPPAENHTLLQTTAPVGPATPGPATYPFLQPPTGADELGRVGNYRVRRLLGAGGMGMVFAADDLALGRPVALKVMRPLPAAEQQSGWRRFVREARALAAIRHDHLVGVYQAFRRGADVFLAMELLEGEPLDAWVRRPNRPAPAEVVRVTRETAAGLAALHARGLIHRDIKPANIWVQAPGGRVKILDLGLVRAVHEDTHLTESGAVVGTPAYMSPEQVRGRPLDARTDLFSLGCVVFALCTGRTPFVADNLMAQAAALAADDPPAVRDLNPAVPAALSDLVADLLAKDPAARPASADEVIARLDGADRPSRTARAGGPRPGDSKSAGTRPWAVAFDVAEVAGGATESGKTARSKRKKRRGPRPSFLRRHRFAVAAGVCLAAAGVGLVAVAGRGKPAAPTPAPEAAETTPKPPPPKPAEPEFLRNLQPSAAVGWPMPKLPPEVDGSVRVNGKVSPNGMFMHPTPPHLDPVRVTYNLGKRYARFTAGMAMNDSAPYKASPVTFVVLRDGVEWRSREVGFANGSPTCDLDVRGVETLTIGVDVRGGPWGAHAVWVEPLLTR
ncbi:MAG: hypothetical protein C0501_01585 [Isosphaera sp.]|nr:hypothetical protein [Isosphaera sp.]